MPVKMRGPERSIVLFGVASSRAWPFAILLGACAAPLAVAPGAMVGSGVDDDGDGLVEADLCPCVAEDPDGFEDDDGCPEADDDQDGVPDVCDLCPREAEIANRVEDDDGCPDTGPIEPAGATEAAPARVVFDAESAALRGSAYPTLDVIASVLRAPGITRVVVTGHASAAEVEVPSDVERLARARAESVVDALVERGVPRALFVVQARSGSAGEDGRAVVFEVTPAPAAPPTSPPVPAPTWQDRCGPLPAPVHACDTGPVEAADVERLGTR